MANKQLNQQSKLGDMARAWNVLLLFDRLLIYLIMRKSGRSHGRTVKCTLFLGIGIVYTTGVNGEGHLSFSCMERICKIKILNCKMARNKEVKTIDGHI